MKVNGNHSPSVVSVDRLYWEKGQVEVRITENVKQLDENLFEYDEYIIHMTDKENLEEEILADIDIWLNYSREKEVNSFSSRYVNGLRDNQELTDTVAVLVEDIYQTDLNTIGG